MTRTSRLTFWVLLFAWGALWARARGAVVISEIMFNPQGTDLDTMGTSNPADDIYREWVELYNTGPSPVSLAGWQFGDAFDNAWATPFPAGTTLAPFQALVVTGDAATFDANWGAGVNRIEVAGFPTLANTPGTDEAAAIRNSTGAIQDLVSFQDDGWPTANGSDGNSIFLLPSALSPTANDDPASWRPSSAGLHGARWTNAGDQGENHGSPGFVDLQTQAPFAPSPDAAWSMVVFPDTQNYAKDTANLPIFFQMTNWVKDHRDEYKIKLVMQEGDIVNQNSQVSPTSGNQSADQQWVNARGAMGVLDGVVPYIMAVGNHDMGTTSAQSRMTQFNTFFAPSGNPLNDPAQHGILKDTYQPGQYQDAYFELNAPDGRKLLIFSLEFWPTQAIVNWASSIASQPKYAEHTAVLVTHSYLNWNQQHTNAGSGSYPIGAGGDYNDGLQLWNELIKVNPNFEMTFSGHVGGDGVAYLQGTNVEGQPVHQMLINAQFETNGGNGWFRLLEFLNDGTTVRVRTFSPFLNLQRTDPANRYLIQLSQLDFPLTDFDHNTIVNNADLGVWRANFGDPSGAIQMQGDADGDGDVDGADFLRWQLANTYAPSPPASAVPEPSAVMLLLVAAGATRCVRRRRDAASNG